MLQDVFYHETHMHIIELNESEQQLKITVFSKLSCTFPVQQHTSANSCCKQQKNGSGTLRLLMLFDILYLFDISYILRPLEMRECQSDNINGTLGPTTDMISDILVTYLFFLLLSSLPVSSPGVAMCLKASTSAHQNSYKTILF